MGCTILVTGGAGYVGSHTAAELLASGHRVVVLDDLSAGHRAAVPAGARFVHGALADAGRLDEVLGAEPIDTVMHFAALSRVGESFQQPYRYLSENIGNALCLVEACVRHGVGQLILSSTANLFGEPARVPISEAAPIVPGSPYGESKHTIERILAWAERIHGLRWASLRYFNAAGAAPSGERGEDHRPETHLIPIVLQVALGQRPEVVIFGDDYPTSDGTCVRDYVHVCDLARAHLCTLEALARGSCQLNVGSGRGYSVREVIETARAVTGAPIPAVVGPRRSGDAPALVAGSGLIRQTCGWAPQHTDLRGIIATAWRWHRSHPEGYAD